MTRFQERKKRFYLILVVFSVAFLLCCSPEKKYQKLHKVIEETQFIDVHAHPVAGHLDYPEKDPYPTLEPPISRPFWPVKRERIAVFDFFEADALRKIYGYTKEDVTGSDLAELKKLSQQFWEVGEKPGFNRVLDICGIERVFANSAVPEEQLDSSRVSWVPFVDELFYPFAASELKADLAYYSRRVKKYSEENNIEVRNLSSYLSLVDSVLRRYKDGNAVAVKVASAYFRTLWFDEQDRQEVESIFQEGVKGKFSQWERYVKVQDYLARYVFLKAGELKLPVHFHTGFGADAGLKSLDSNPLNLESVFSDIRFKDTQFLILHAGYPFWDKLKPLLEKRNVFVEFSAVNWMVFEKELAGILGDWLSYPGLTEKVMFGSDAGAPVFFWIAAKNSRRALYGALAKLIDEGLITEEKAILITKKIMRENALLLHS